MVEHIDLLVVVGVTTDDGSTIVGDTNLLAVTKATILVVWAPVAFVEATILTIHPPSLFGNTVGGETNPTAFVGATISAVWPSDLHHK